MGVTHLAVAASERELLDTLDVFFILARLCAGSPAVFTKLS